MIERFVTIVGALRSAVWIAPTIGPKSIHVLTRDDVGRARCEIRRAPK